MTALSLILLILGVSFGSLATTAFFVRKIRAIKRIIADTNVGLAAVNAQLAGRHVSLLCHLKAGTDHEPCSGSCDGHGSGRPCAERCCCSCHGSWADYLGALSIDLCAIEEWLREHSTARHSDSMADRIGEAWQIVDDLHDQHTARERG